MGSQYASATHLVGGYITYDHLGNNSYALKLRVYRDCNPSTFPFDSIADIDIRDNMGNVIFSLDVTKGPTIPLDTDTSGCVSTPPGICIEYADYIDTIILPPLQGGYLIDYASCCRNSLIVNIPRPLSKGYTYNTTIPSNDSLGNSSPEFIGSPPVLVCLNRPIDIDMHVQEDDGDSLHYELCDIYDQGYPYQPIPYLQPYSSQVPIPATPPFSVDPLTGKLSGKPTHVGHYVVGICVTEWRNGMLQSTIRLDYQFNVTSCNSLYSDILTQAEDSSLYCQGLNMKFYSQSQNATSYYWDFGDTTTAADTSGLQNPSYSYSQPGIYTVTLIADPGDPCGDTAVVQFEVLESFTPDFEVADEYCFSDQPITLEALGNYPPGATFSWNFGPYSNLPSSQLWDPPPISWSRGGNHYVELTVRHGKCKITHGDTIKLGDELRSDMVLPAEDPSLACNGLTVKFISESIGATYLKWDFGDGTTPGDTSNADTAYYSYPQPGRYKVTLIAGQDGKCYDTSSYWFDVLPALDPQILKSGLFCFEAQDVTLEAVGTYPPGTQFSWDLGPLASQSIINNPSATNISWQQPGVYVVSLTASNGFCIETVFDTVKIPAWSVAVDAGPDQTIKQGELIQLSSPTITDQYYWYSNRPVSISNSFGRNTSVQIPSSGDTTMFYLKVTDANGCQGIDTLWVYIITDDSDKGYNVLTPNGDGDNDYLDLSAFMHGGVCEFSVLNRWGSEVYHAEKYQNDWPGVDYRGRLLPDGTYYYILFCDREVTVKGPITIIRNNMR